MKWADVYNYVDMVLPKTGWKPSRVQIMMLCNQALTQMRCRTGSWSNKNPFVSVSSLLIPPDCIQIHRITYKGDMLTRVSLETMIQMFGQDFQDNTEDPTHWAINGSKTVYNATFSCAVGEHVTDGLMNLGVFSENPTADNPLDYVPIGFQLLPAYYALANMPGNINDDNLKSIKQEYQRMWQERYQEFMLSISRRKGEEFHY